MMFPVIVHYFIRKQVNIMATDLIRVLVVDDNKDLTSIISRLFAQYADIIPVGTAGSGQEALNMIRKGKIDVVLLDIIMPGMDGMQVLAEISRMGDNKPAVIVLSALGSSDIIKRALDLGADYYLVKPVDAIAMIEKIRLAYKSHRGLKLAKVDI
jgi:two-component system response regulator (stage 0 sporulation protein A)